MTVNRKPGLIFVVLVGPIWFLLSANVFAADVKVGLFQKHLPRFLIISAKPGVIVRDAKTQQFVLATKPADRLKIEKAGDKIQITAAGQAPCRLQACQIAPRDQISAVNIELENLPSPRQYSGTLTIRGEREWLLAINHVQENEYLAAVVNAEMPASWPAAALEAQAVAARTYAARYSGRHSQDGYDFCDLAHCQVYAGQQQMPKAVIAAAQRTQGQILCFQHTAIEACYHSCCGGHTVSAGEIWPQSAALSYLQGQPDQGGTAVYCSASPEYHWSLRLKASQLGALYPGVNSMAIASRFPSGRVAALKLIFPGREQIVSAEEFYLAWGRNLSWNQIKSNWYELEPAGRDWLLTGRGLGHGVGLCQWGARGRALAGAGCAEILEHYFPGAKIENAEMGK